MKSNKYQQNMRDRRRAQGLCSRCGKEEVSGTEYCENCRKKQRDYHRKHIIGTKNGCIRGAKRLYPIDEKCELCDEKKRLVYHHWDDSKPELGIWICVNCHTIAGYVESGKPNIFDRYLELKHKIEEV